MVVILLGSDNSQLRFLNGECDKALIVHVKGKLGVGYLFIKKNGSL